MKTCEGDVNLVRHFLILERHLLNPGKFSIKIRVTKEGNSGRYGDPSVTVTYLRPYPRSGAKAFQDIGHFPLVHVYLPFSVPFVEFPTPLPSMVNFFPPLIVPSIV